MHLTSRAFFVGFWSIEMAVILKMDVPVKRLENLEAARLMVIKYTFFRNDEKILNDPDHFVCFHCGGQGKVRDPKDRDVVEGYKGAPWYKCTHCNGSGRGHKDDYEKMVEKSDRVYAEECNKYSKLNERFQSIKTKLTEEELEFVLTACRRE